ncbi:hypothetical protein ACH5RR_033902 [Cinchona calisaya]|uniref:mitogen-activated protein kinase kinase kinase n=1 Tax=Cinchona calisaya TaxID=153742 RepID=A0ABD2YAL2_9GENT
MYRLPKIFIIHKNKSSSRRSRMDSTGGSGRSSSSSGGSPAKPKPKPRLERLNAMKNMDYELPSTSSLSSEEDSSISSASSSAAALRTRSLDVYPFSEKASFRIEGNEGDYDAIFRSLGLSGPEDFAIPTDAWEAMKVRSSSDVVPRFSRLNYSIPSPEGIPADNSTPVANSNVKEVAVSCPRVIDVISPKIEGIDFGCSDSSTANSGVSLTSPQIVGIDFGCSDTSSAMTDYGYLDNFTCSRGDMLLNSDNLIIAGVDGGSGGVASNCVSELSARLVDSVRVSDIIFPTSENLDGVRGSDAACLGENEGVKLLGRCGIKGVRPPALAPPPVMSLRVIDNGCSTWDILRSFAPEDDRVSLRCKVGEAVSSGGEEGGKVVEEVEEDHNVMVRRTIAGENGGLSESCSFSTNSNDDDSSSTTTEPMSSNSPNYRFRHIITFWQKGELLGRGSFGSVYEGIANDGFFFAVKEVSLLDQGEEGRQSIYQLEQEIALLSQFKHENIVQYYGTEKDESKLYIFLELVTQGSLLSLYQKYDLKDSQVSAYTRQILHGLKYLHDRNVVHRDIKCANILVHADGSVKLADFGLAKATKLNDVKSCKGTAFWMAPEVVNRTTQGYGLAADIWSLGCTVLEMLTRQFPYSHLEPMAALFRIGRGEPPRIPERLSGDAREFILECLQVNPFARPTAAQLLNHPFVMRQLPASCSASPYHPSRRV